MLPTQEGQARGALLAQIPHCGQWSVCQQHQLVTGVVLLIIRKEAVVISFLGKSGHKDVKGQGSGRRDMKC